MMIKYLISQKLSAIHLVFIYKLFIYQFFVRIKRYFFFKKYDTGSKLLPFTDLKFLYW